MYGYEFEMAQDFARQIEREEKGIDRTEYRVLMCEADEVWMPISDKVYLFADSAVSAMRKYHKEHRGCDIKVQSRDVYYDVSKNSVWKDYLTLEQYDEYRDMEETGRPYSPSCPWYASGMKISDFI